MTRIPRGAAQFKWRRQRQEKARRWPSLNLVALMDVFTILVFFLLQGEPVVTVASVMQTSRGEIKALRAALQAQIVSDSPIDAGQEVTIMGDKSIPFALLNRVMQTCKRAGYGNISLSVLQRSSGAG